MPIGVTAKGTALNGNVNSNLNLASVACLTGDLLILTGVCQQTGATAKWNNISMSVATFVEISTSGPIYLYIFYLVIASGATATATLSFSGFQAAALSVSTVQGIVTASPLDQVASAGLGTGSSPSSGATPTTSQASEIAWGAIGKAGSVTTVGGSWSNSFTDNQSVSAGTSIALNDGYLILSATGAQTAAKTGTNAGSNWGALCATFKGSAASGVVAESLISSQAVNRSASF